MTIEIDDRLVRVSIEINGQLKVYSSPMFIESSGTKYANPLQNEADIRIANLTKADRDYFLTETSPFNKNATPKKIILEAGRVSTGLSKIYEGDITSCIPTQPPDIILQFKSQTANFKKGDIVSSQQSGSTSLSSIAKQVASELGVSLRFEATDKNIANYAFTGGALKQVDKLGSIGAVSAYVDDGELIVKNIDLPLQGTERILNDKSGMIGIPQVTEQGIKVTMLLDNVTKCGGALKVDSVIYPTVNGEYVIYKLGWAIASRDTPFYWIAEAKRNGYNAQVQEKGSSTKRKSK